MRIMISGTDTNIGKTLISSWLCLHTRYDYFKPIQTGNEEDTDTHTVRSLAKVQTHSEIYSYKEPASPHYAAHLEKEEIDLYRIHLPLAQNLIVEGAGGLLVPLNKNYLLIDMIQHLSLPTILVSSTRLGTINHTLLSLEALRSRKIPVIGIIMSGPPNEPTCEAITFYGGTPILAHLPFLRRISSDVLQQIPLPHTLMPIFERAS